MNSILVRSPNWIGDQILAYPFFYELRKAFPKAKIGVVTVPWVEALQFRNLVDEVFVLPKPDSGSFTEKFKVLETTAKTVRASGKWELAISLPNSLSSAWLLFRSRARIRRGFLGDGRGFLLNQRLPEEIQDLAHRSDAYLRLLPEGIKPSRSGTDFWGVPPENELDPGVPGVIPFFDAYKEWPSTIPLEAPGHPYWVLAPGSVAESRRWPLERFAELASVIFKETQMKALIVGGPAEAPAARHLIEDYDAPVLDWTAKGSVTSYWPIFRSAKFTVANDSGLAHLASLSGSPVYITWGAGDPKRTRPIGPGKVQISLNPIDCWPCERNTCSLPPGRQMECLRGIEVDTVWKEIWKFRNW